MQNWIRYIAIALNALAIAGLLALAGEARISPGDPDFWIVLLALTVPLVSLYALAGMPDGEERALLRAVRKARLRRELKDLETPGE